MEFKTGVIKPVECFQEGWELIKDQYWLFLGITIVGILIASFIPFGIGLGAMFCGIYYCFLQKINRQPVKFEDLFKGFNYFLPGLVATLILVVPMIVSMILMYGSIAAVFLSSIDSHGRINESAIYALYGTLMIEGLIVAIVLSCLQAFVMFAFPLIVEHKLSGWAAFKLSTKAVWSNLSAVVGLILCEFVIGLIGYMLCGIGLYFTLPIMFAGITVAYRKVFPNGMNNYNSPPSPPNFGENLGNWQS